MAVNQYKCTMTFASFRFEADFAEAASNIRSLPDDDEDGDGEALPFQVADAGHDPERAALLLLEYFGPDFWLAPDSIIETGEDGEQTFDGMTRKDYIEGLIVSVKAE